MAELQVVIVYFFTSLMPTCRDYKTANPNSFDLKRLGTARQKNTKGGKYNVTTFTVNS